MAAASLFFLPRHTPYRSQGSSGLSVDRLLRLSVGQRFGKAKLIASPPTGLEMIVAYRPASGFLVSRDVHVAGTEKGLS